MPRVLLEDLYRNHRDAMWNAALRLSGDAGAAEDVIHDVFKALATAPRDLGHPRAYLLKAVIHRVRDLQRRPSIVGGEQVLEVAVDPTPEPALALAADEEKAAVADAMAGLPIAQREVVVLHAFEQMGFRAIGELCGAPTSTVASRWRYACAAMRETLTRRGVRAQCTQPHRDNVEGIGS